MTGGDWIPVCTGMTVGDWIPAFARMTRGNWVPVCTGMTGEGLGPSLRWDKYCLNVLNMYK